MKINKEELEVLINQNLSTRKIADKFGLSQTAIRYWLNKHGLKTNPIWTITKKFKHSDELILEVWSKSDSLNQFLLNLGVDTSGGSFYHYKKRLRKLGIDIDNFIKNGTSRGGLKVAKIRNEKTIKRRIRLSRPTLKKSMDLANVIYKCNICGIFEWLSKKLKLHIHHKDEDKTNNHISNLEYLCPNCHGIQHYTEE